MITPPPTDQSAPTAPYNLGTWGSTATSINLNWFGSTDTGGSGVAGYRVYRQQGSGPSLPVGTTSPGIGVFTDAPLQPSTTYTYVIRAFDNAQNYSAASSPLSVTTGSVGADTTAPTAPQNFSGIALRGVGWSKVELAWTKSVDTGGSGLANYRVYRNGVLVGSPTSTTFTDTGLQPATLYNYAVAAVDGNSNASSQSTAAVTTLRDVLYLNDFTGNDGATGGYYRQFDLLQFSMPSSELWAPQWQGYWSTLSGQSNFKANIDVLNRPASVDSGMSFWGTSSPGREYRAFLDGAYLRLNFISWYQTWFEECQCIGWAFDEIPLRIASAPTPPGTLAVETNSSNRTIKVYWNGILKIDYTEADTSRPTAGYIGVFSRVHSAPSENAVYDNFIVER